MFLMDDRQTKRGGSSSRRGGGKRRELISRMGFNFNWKSFAIIILLRVNGLPLTEPLPLLLELELLSWRLLLQSPQTMDMNMAVS